MNISPGPQVFVGLNKLDEHVLSVLPGVTVQEMVVASATHVNVALPPGHTPPDNPVND